MLKIDDIVTGGLCIGCGLCRALAGADRISMVTTPEGRERPVVTGTLCDEDLAAINAVCPGTRIEGADPSNIPTEAETDLIWGPALPTTMAIAHAADPEVRFRGAAGGRVDGAGAVSAAHRRG